MTKPVDANIFEQLLRDVDSVKKELQVLKNNKTVNLPIRSVTHLPDFAGEGDIVIAESTGIPSSSGSSLPWFLGSSGSATLGSPAYNLPDPLEFDGIYETSTGTNFSYNIGDSRISILTSGLYILKFRIDLNSALSANPTYEWQAHCDLWLEDTGSSYFGIQSVGLGGGPGRSGEGTITSDLIVDNYPYAHALWLEKEKMFNLVDSYVTWPLKINGSFSNTIANADKGSRFRYNISGYRLGNANADLGSP